MLIRDRIRELRRVKASELRPNRQNWRLHPPAQQDALRGVLAEIGYAGALLARELPDGTLELIDGHLRAETTPEVEVPVLVLDLDEREAAKLLAVYDPLAGLAECNQPALAELTAGVETENAALRGLLDDLLGGDPAAGQPAEPANPAEVEIPRLFELVVECEDVEQQQSLYARLKSEGFKCRVLTL